MSYFSYFPNRTDYSVSLINSDLTREIRVPVTFPDFFRHVALAFPKVNDGKYFYEQVRVLDRERPDQLSYRLYGNDSYYWTFFILNDKLRLGEAIQWPLSYEQLTNKLEREYDGETIVTFKSRYLKSILPGLTFKKDNFLYNKFRIGEIVTGDKSGVSGVIANIRPEFGQIVTKNLFARGSDFPAVNTVQLKFRPGEIIRGENPNVTVICDESLRNADAVYRYIEPATGRDVDCRNFILTDHTNTVSGLSTLTFRQYYEQMNENLSSIRVLKKNSVREFVDAFRTLIARKPKPSDSRKTY